MNNLRCKPGDLCLIISGKYNSGKVVTTIRLATEEEIRKFLMPKDKSPIWLVDIDIKWRYRPKDFPEDPGKIVFQPYIHDRYLLPINGLPEEEDEEQSKEIPVS